MLETYHGVYLWKYIPNLVLSLIFLALFTIATLSWLEIIQDLTAATFYTDNLSLYLLTSVFLVVPPIMFAATLYMLYSRLVCAVIEGGERRFLSPSLSPVPVRWASRIFIIGDFGCFMIQGNAAGLLGKQDLTQIADYIIIVGLVLQIIVFVFFIGCCAIFHRRIRIQAGVSIPTHVPWQSCLNMLYVTSSATLVRNIYRVVEFVMQSADPNSYLLTTEWPLYVFDGALMILIMVIFYIWYPMNFNQEESRRLSWFINS
ncbi:hypothetical protein ASPZODRAFT_155346 [Penicilliopsis zonata CBS 506.65]|uniref:RTA1 domain protein n=1 Tax=Penicilliopsis zonata CBS 506.65 TaxID=1073090 RepID=A0A1L9S596_9EURO|nr:hypothetical protein ASPZODRAFT_155346 [Penicilliopsis zonata CBS 506.65]OJJ42328.1 hypothetical protein ASPZODRAFT_155346 [Penicilliopsis zonata CBS 506.65]